MQNTNDTPQQLRFPAVGQIPTYAVPTVRAYVENKKFLIAAEQWKYRTNSTNNLESLRAENIVLTEFDFEKLNKKYDRIGLMGTEGRDTYYKQSLVIGFRIYLEDCGYSKDTLVRFTKVIGSLVKPRQEPEDWVRTPSYFARFLISLNYNNCRDYNFPNFGGVSTKSFFEEIQPKFEEFILEILGDEE